MRLVVFGGRKFGHIEPSMKEKDLILALSQEKAFEIAMARFRQKNQIDFLIYGDATGADALIDRWAHRNEIGHQRYDADWARLGNPAGPIRNQQMIDDGKPDMAIGFPGGAGTADMTRRCIKALGDAKVLRSMDIPRHTEAPFDSTEDTLNHIQRVRYLLREFSMEIFHRGMIHDQSKLGPYEKYFYDNVGVALAGLKYGTPEYNASLAKLGSGLAHHYSNNRHHPEWHTRGVDGMTLGDIVEMFMDWKAAGERHANGSIMQSIEHNKTRFNLSSQLESIFNNTAKELGWK